MATITDPATELAEIAKRLAKPTSVPGEKFLAEQFNVKAWSTDFFKIITCIFDRADQVARIVNRSSTDDDFRESALSDISGFKKAFSGDSLRNTWNNNGHGLTLMKDHGRPIQYLSTLVRSEVCYAKLTDKEVKEFLDLIDEYISQLDTIDDSSDFVRQAIKDGLTTFRFQLDRIGWLGSGYTLAAFREVMFVYEASKRQYADMANPDASAVLSGLLNIVKKFQKKVDEAQGWSDSAESVLKLYQFGSGIIATPLLMEIQF